MTQATADQESGGGAEAGKDDKPAKTFTQTELEDIIGKRLASERAKFADYDALRVKAGELDKIRDANQSEMEKAVVKAKAEGISEATTRANQVLIRAEARALAAAANFHNPRDAAQLLDLSGIKVTEDGDVDSDAIKALIDDAAKERPYLIKTEDRSTARAPRRDPAQGPRPGEKPGGREAGLAEALRRFGPTK